MRVRRLAAGGLLAAAVVIGAARPAAAQLGECDVQVSGSIFENGSHVEVPASRQATIEVVAMEDRPRYRVHMELAGQRWLVGTGRGDGFGWSRRLNIADYAKFGVGTYRLRVTTIVNGKPCVASGLMDITGRSPLTTVAGGATAALAVVGVAGLAVGLFRRGGRPLRTRHGFGVDNPLAEFDAVDTPGNYVGWAEVACDQGTRTFVTAKPGSEAVRAFMREPKTHVELAEVRSRGVRVRAGESATVLPRLRWRPRPYLVAPLLGMVAATGVVGFLQQSAVLFPTFMTLVVTIAAGVLGGLIIANVARLLGAAALNRRLHAAEAGLEVEAIEPRYPPIDHLDELDTFVWTPTHTVPDNDDDEGQPAWEAPDKTQEPVATLDPGLPVRITDRRDGLAQVVCSNGWVGWTDADPLVAIDS